MLVMELSARRARNFLCLRLRVHLFRFTLFGKLHPSTSWQAKDIQACVSADSSLTTSSIPSCSSAAIRPPTLRPLKASVTRQNMEFGDPEEGQATAKRMLWHPHGGPGPDTRDALRSS
jgi:hypothetical protein